MPALWAARLALQLWSSVLESIARLIGQLPCQVRSILDILVEMLATPSEPVQRAVSDCMPALMPGLSADRPFVDALVAQLLKQLGHKSYGHRCVSGRQAMAPMRKHEVMRCLPSRPRQQEFASGALSVDMRRHRRHQPCSWLGRRGAAFGLAGVVKGLGIAALRGYGVLDALRAGVEDKSSADAREGALFAYQALVEKLGRMFEPYVVQVLLCAEG